jgi:MFS family permease
MRQPAYAVALFAAATGSGVMVLAMTATPLAMLHHHHSLSEATIVIQAHVLGVFAPSFFMGALIARFGVLQIMLVGVVLLGGHVSLSGTGFGSFGSALILLGVVWNFLEKVTVQGERPRAAFLSRCALLEEFTGRREVRKGFL